MTWELTAVDADDLVLGPHRVEIALPPGWWSLAVTSPDARESIDAYVTGRVVPELRDGLAAELDRLVAVAATAGAVLIGIGAAVDEEAHQVVTATLMLTPLRVAGLPAEAAPRTLHLTVVPTLVGGVRMLIANYVVAQRWWLSLQTPALDHADDMVGVFDTIAEGVRVSPRVGVADAFGAQR